MSPRSTILWRCLNVSQRSTFFVLEDAGSFQKPEIEPTSNETSATNVYSPYSNCLIQNGFQFKCPKTTFGSYKDLEWTINRRGYLQSWRKKLRTTWHIWNKSIAHIYQTANRNLLRFPSLGRTKGSFGLKLLLRTHIIVNLCVYIPVSLFFERNASLQVWFFVSEK